VVSVGSVCFDFYGLRVELRSADGSTVERIRRDFSFFEAAPTAPEATIEVFDEKPDFSSLPDLPASIHALNYVCYRGNDAIYTDYHGMGLSVSDLGQREYRVFSDNADLRHEISYLTVLSAVGQYLDSRHIHRVHALGISKNGKAILVLLPEKGGKTTLALRLLKSGQVKLLSEDSPLITRKGEVLPFPLRLGILPGAELDIPEQYRHPASFMGVGTKILVDVAYYAEGVSPPCPSRVILLGKRTLGCDSRIEAASRLSAAKELVKNSVVGLGLHQGMEYLLGRSIWQTTGNAWLAFSRLRNCLALLRCSRVYRYHIGHDMERNHEVLLGFLDALDS